MEKANIPKIRFDKFNDDWEQRKLGEVATYKNGKGHEDNQSDEGTYELINLNSISIDGGLKPSGKFIEDGSDTLLENDLVMVLSDVGHGDLLGRVAIIPENNRFVLNQRVALLRINDDTNPYFLFSIINRHQDYFKKLGAGSSQLNISRGTVEDFVVDYPCQDEQRKIAKCFQNLDTLITLHQRKYEKLQMIKKSMLEKMFPQNGEKKPEIRFEGFTDDWEQRKWCDTVDISTEMVDPTSGEYDDMPHIAPGNIESFTGRILDNVKSVKEEQLISGKFRFRPGDVVYGKINPQLGKYFYASVDGLTSADAYVFNGKNGVTQKFLFSLLQTEDFFKYSVSVSKRSGMPKINRDELNAYGFLAPKEEEQEQIGSFLLEIDNLITLHQRKLEKLRNIKKSMLEKMFV